MSFDTDMANRIKDAAIRRGVLTPAIVDILNRASLVFREVDDVVLPVKPGTANEVWYGKDAKPLSVDEWVDRLTLDAPHLFHAWGRQ